MKELLEQIRQEQEKQEQIRVLACNQRTERFGLSLTKQDVLELMEQEKQVLKENQRIELGEGILPKIIEYFCDSEYITQDSYKETLEELQQVFFLFKNESEDLLNDDELLEFMKKQFEDVCRGDMEYLSGTCLERFTRAIRGGYLHQAVKGGRDEYVLRSGGENEYSRFSEETGWESQVYYQKLEDLF